MTSVRPIDKPRTSRLPSSRKSRSALSSSSSVKSRIPALLHRLIFGLIYLLPAALFCSYHPVIKLGETTSMHLELSLPLIWLVIFDLAAFVALCLAHRTQTQKRRKISATSNLEAAPNPKTPSHFQTKRAHHWLFGRELPGISDRRFFLFALFPFYATLSIFWSANPLRALLTAGIIWLIFFAVFAFLYLLPLFGLPPHFRRRFLFSFFLASVIICLVCWVQCFLDVASFSRDFTLLCRGCISHAFGFPHPSGFAIEPQFMGNLLLAPTLTALYLLIFCKSSREKNSNACSTAHSVKRPSATNEEKDERRRACNDGTRQACLVLNERTPLIGLATLFSSNLFLTFSRGAIYAYLIALLVLLIFLLRRLLRTRIRAFSYLIAIPLFSFLFVLVLQGTFTVLGPTHGTFFEGVSRSVHQLSLGLIDLRSSSHPSETAPVSSPEAPEWQSNSNPPTDQALAQNPANSPLDPSSDNSTTSATPETTSEPPTFDGYVAESTDVRLSLNAAALQTWLSTPVNFFFGVGLGGAGTALYRNSAVTGITSPKEIVQHQGFSLLLELGLVGVLLALFDLLLAFFPQLFPAKFRDGRAATAAVSPSSTTSVSAPSSRSTSPSPSSFPPISSIWHHPALPLLISLILAYLVTLNFFSGLPNALQIYLLPPLLYLIFLV